MKILSLLFCVLTLSIFSSTTSYAQNEKLISSEKFMQSQHDFSADEMNDMWKKFSGDNAWKNLLADATTKDFKRINHDKAAWGFKGVMVDENGKKHDVLFCAYDFYHAKDKRGQGCSMIWRKIDNEIYKAYIVFPAGEKDMEKAFDGAQEWFTDKEGKVQKAHSWNKCFRNCINGGKHKVEIDGVGKISADCKNSCLASIAVCGVTTGILAAATGGFTVPVAIALFAGCSAVGCSQCLAICALGCM